MFAGATEGSLVAGTGPAHRLPASPLRALPGTVEVPAVALCADADLHPATLTVVEPVGRRLLLELAQALPPRQHWTAPGRRGITGPAKPPPKALSIEGPGFDANQTARALVLLAISTTSIAEAGSATAGAGTSIHIESQQGAFCPADGRSDRAAAMRPRGKKT